jgi:hypothetical protein
MILEHVRRLNDVIIHADQNHVVFKHGRSSPTRDVRRWGFRGCYS